MPEASAEIFDTLDWIFSEGMEFHMLKVNDTRTMKSMWWTTHNDPDGSGLQQRQRAYSPTMGRFAQSDPIGYADGPNIYQYLGDNPLIFVDSQGTDRYRPSNLHVLSGHPVMAVDAWKCEKGFWVKDGYWALDFKPAGGSTWIQIAGLLITNGHVDMVKYGPGAPPASKTFGGAGITSIPSTPLQDLRMVQLMQLQVAHPPPYSLAFNNSQWWMWNHLHDGMAAGGDPRGAGPVPTPCDCAPLDNTWKPNFPPRSMDEQLNDLNKIINWNL